MARRKSSNNDNHISLSEWERQMVLNSRKQSKTSGRKPKRQVIEDEDPDYDSMSLAEFGQQVQSTSQDCMELGISSSFNAARAFDRGDYIEGTVEACKAGVGILSVVAIVAQLLGAASGRD